MEASELHFWERKLLALADEVTELQSRLPDDTSVWGANESNIWYALQKIQEDLQVRFDLVGPEG